MRLNIKHLLISVLFAVTANAQVLPVDSTIYTTWQACSARIDTTTNSAIQAAVAGTRIYVTGISCDNDTTVATGLVFRNGSTQIWRGAISNTTLAGRGGYTIPLLTPLRLSVATAFNFSPDTNSSGVTCCANGFLSRAP